MVHSFAHSHPGHLDRSFQTIGSKSAEGPSCLSALGLATGRRNHVLAPFWTWSFLNHPSMICGPEPWQDKLLRSYPKNRPNGAQWDQLGRSPTRHRLPEWRAHVLVAEVQAPRKTSKILYSHAISLYVVNLALLMLEVCNAKQNFCRGKANNLLKFKPRHSSGQAACQSASDIAMPQDRLGRRPPSLRWFRRQTWRVVGPWPF